MFLIINRYYIEFRNKVWTQGVLSIPLKYIKYFYVKYIEYFVYLAEYRRLNLNLIIYLSNSCEAYDSLYIGNK